MTRDAELDLLEPVRAAFGERHERDLEAAARHRQFLHAGGHRHAERLRRLRARLRQLLRVGQIRLLRLVGNRLQRAQIGRGVALGPRPLIADELASGRLVTPLPGPRIATRSYWWIAPRETANDVLVGRFCAWLDAQAQAS